MNIWEFGNNIFTNGFLTFAIRAAVIWFLATVFVKIILRRMNKRLIAYTGEKQSLQLKYAFQTVRFLVYLIAVFFILSEVKSLTSLGTGALGITSILAVGVSLAAQQTLGNYISGFFLALYQPFTIGDFITLKDQGISGTVQEMSFRHTVLHTIENTTLIIPNSTMNSAIIEDCAKNDLHYVKWMSVGVSYDSNFDKVKEIITHVVTSQPGYIDERTLEQMALGEEPITVRLDDFQDSSLLLKYKVICPDYGSSWQIASNIRIQLKKEFDQNGINIPYPITTVQMNDEKISKT